MSNTNFYICEKCGNLVGAIHESGVPMKCCGQSMTKIEAGVVEASREKHIPVIEQNGNKVLVKIGEAEHPMVEVHYIEWIILETATGYQKKELKPGEKPEADFAVTEPVIAAYEYCNLHGLWVAKA